MGRRPNAIVSEYFLRGQKLEDASNRYAHTCRRCGEFFPKGRIDNLTSHLLRRCPNLTNEDRQRVFQYTQQQRPITRQADPDSIQRPPSPPTMVRYSMPNTEAGDVSSLAARREQSALDTLAEVSRRHLDYSTAHGHDNGEWRHALDPERLIAEQALLMQLQHAAGSHSTDTLLLATETNARPQSKSHQPLEPDIIMHDDPPANTPNVTGVSPAEQMQISAAEVQGIDPQLNNIDPTTEEVGVASSSGQIEEDATLLWTPTTVTHIQDPASGEEPSASPEPVSDFGLLHRISRNHTRVRFNDVRRKEVQEIRKLGACLRCRMLKKPCSEDTPCTTCRAVERARLWKTACVRTRLAEVFTLWSTGLFHAKAKIEVPRAVRGLQHTVMMGRIEVRFFAAKNLRMTFAARKYSANLGSREFITDTVLPRLRQDSPAQAIHQQGQETAEIWLLDEEEALSHKVSHYAKRVMNSCVAEHTSSFFKATILRAQENIIVADGDQALTAAQPTRSCYNLRDHLLWNVVELWILTCILADVKSIILQLHYNAENSPCGIVEDTYPIDEDDRPTDVREPFSKLSKELIRTQLLAATESRCSALSKIVTNELERRLLQRQQVSRFETFLSATILLSCVERMTGVFRELDVSDSATEAEAPTNDDRILKLHSWPLVQWPKELWPQGEHFADLLIMLLRLRALPPPTRSLADGRLAVSQMQAGNGKHAAKPEIQEQVDMTAEWLDPIELQMDELLQIRDRDVPAQGAGVEAWDMRFISRILLPEEKA